MKPKLMQPKLMPKQKEFAERTLLYRTYRTITDAYISVYQPTGSRRTATASASRIYNKPAVQAYLMQIRAIAAQRAVDKQEAEHQAFLAKLKGY